MEIQLLRTPFYDFKRLFCCILAGFWSSSAGFRCLCVNQYCELMSVQPREAHCLKTKDESETSRAKDQVSHLSVPAVTSCSCFGRILQLLLQVVNLLLKDVALVFPVRGLLLISRRTETRQA